MKSILLIGFVLTTLYAQAQENKFFIGITYQPFIYENYNKSDWNNGPRSYPEIPNNFNGQAFGLVFGKPLTDYFSIKLEAAYSEQYQDHKLPTFSEAPIELLKIYGTSVHTEFELIKMPIMASFSYEIGYNSGLFINGFVGGQISFLTSYLSRYEQLYFDIYEMQIDEDFIQNLIIRSPRKSYNRIWDGTLMPTGFREYNFDTDYLYNRWLFGALGGIEFQKKITPYFSVCIGGRMEYDFTNSEKYPDWTFPTLGGLGIFGPRAKSHNFRYGLNFSVMYYFK